jgi:hypothetical protein
MTTFRAVFGTAARCDTLGDTGPRHLPGMITIECTWCDGELTLESLDATTIDCPECRVSVEMAADDEALAAAA